MIKFVYVCLAFFGAGVIFLIASSRNEDTGLQGMSHAMVVAVQSGATVLDADRYGAVTQSGDGVVRGWTRGGKQLWSRSFDRFAAGPQNPYGAGAIDASASCVGSCPTAVVGVGGSYDGHGSAGAATLAASLSTLPQVAQSKVLATTAPASAVVSVVPGVGATPELVAVDGRIHRRVPSPNPRIAHRFLPVTNPKIAQFDIRGDRMIVGSAPTAQSARLDSFETGGRGWVPVGTPYEAQALSNACFASGGALTATVSSYVHLFRFGAPPGVQIGPPIASGTCTIAGGGITVVYTAPGSGSVLVARYSARGLRIWIRNLGVRTLLSHAGSPTIAVQGNNGELTAIDAVSGKTVLRRVVAGQPYVARDGSILTADRKGRPAWLLGGH
jgi:hypothetical protein